MTGRLTVVTYNIRNGEWQNELAGSLRYLMNQGTDLFCFQEVRDAHTVKNISTCLGKDWEYLDYLPSPASPYDYGLAMFWNASRLRLKKSDRLALPAVSSLTLTEKLYDAYMIRGARIIRRGALFGTFSVSGTEFRIATTHLDWHGGILQRMAQLQNIRAYLKKGHVRHEVICGDFNTLGNRAAVGKQQLVIRNILDGYDDVFPDVRWTIFLDFNRRDPIGLFQKLLSRLGIRFYRRFDYAFVRGFRVLEALPEYLSGSDHIPLLMTLAW